MVNRIVRNVSILALVICSLNTGAQETLRETGHIDQEKTQWLAKAMMTIVTVKPGMTRVERLKVFTTEGGLSTRYQRTYVFQECPLIKVNVEFVQSKGENGLSLESSSDVIAKISRPCLGSA